MAIRFPRACTRMFGPSQTYSVVLLACISAPVNGQSHASCAWETVRPPALESTHPVYVETPSLIPVVGGLGVSAGLTIVE